jgi:S1-C subfamily serine protease
VAADGASPLVQAGLRSGDVILELNYRPIRGPKGFEQAIETIGPGQSVSVLGRRGDTEILVAVTR